MIIGTGIDIVEVNRIAERIEKRNGFVEMVFSEKERVLCESRPRKAEHYAVRFAAKEAFLKAVGTGLNVEHTLSNIEILNDEAGKPYISLHGVLAEMKTQAGWKRMHVSLSHIESTACAIVIIET